MYACFCLLQILIRQDAPKLEQSLPRRSELKQAEDDALRQLQNTSVGNFTYSELRPHGAPANCAQFLSEDSSLNILELMGPLPGAGDTRDSDAFLTTRMFQYPGMNAAKVPWMRENVSLFMIQTWICPLALQQASVIMHWNILCKGNLCLCVHRDFSTLPEDSNWKGITSLWHVRLGNFLSYSCHVLELRYDELLRHWHQESRHNVSCNKRNISCLSDHAPGAYWSPKVIKKRLSRCLFTRFAWAARDKHLPAALQKLNPCMFMWLHTAALRSSMVAISDESVR